MHECTRSTLLNHANLNIIHTATENSTEPRAGEFVLATYTDQIACTTLSSLSLVIHYKGISTTTYFGPFAIALDECVCTYTMYMYIL